MRRLKAEPPGEDAVRLVQAGLRLFQACEFTFLLSQLYINT